jgi:DNA polymerase III sliding clamp (beta) subunit (PCNA family)
MKIPVACKIELCASKDETRLCLVNPYFDKAANAIIATQGMSMAIVPVESDESDVSGFVSPTALAMARKQARKGEGGAEIYLNGSQLLADKTVLVRPSEESNGRFPNWQQVVPKMESEAYGTIRIGLNAKLLWELAQAIGSECVCLSIKDANSPLIVTPSGGSKPVACRDAKGILMPLRVS